ncbi:DUF6192 family protein [Streptomyces sp. MNU89]|uniref:DUF6192 family protein n=1 Tax=Streptomyces sp. MNU89 TaxID=2560025 RepID=UPI001E5BE838|nr:DUF6192 family protein [Streptomyces sp. MNU89]MCC9738343.1 DUF6192 family protein [Streptomyces sp. MNU89]
MPASTKVGSVTRQRYEELVDRDRKLVLDESKIQFKVGDDALEIEPLRQHGGSHPSTDEEACGVRQTLEMFAEDVGLSYSQVRIYRYTAGKWPAEHRAEGVPFEIHRILEKLEDRFERILKPPRHPRNGRLQWTGDAAKRQVGWQVDTPKTVQEKVEAIHDLASDEQVAVRVATDFLRRPAVAFRAAGDDTARHLFNKAQSHRAVQAEKNAEAPVPGQENPVAPAVRAIDRTLEFLDLVGACHKFVSSTSRLVPLVRDRDLSEDAREVIGHNLSRVRAACDWVEHAVSTGETDMDEELARLLRGE